MMLITSHSPDYQRLLQSPPATRSRLNSPTLMPLSLTPCWHLLNTTSLLSLQQGAAVPVDALVLHGYGYVVKCYLKEKQHCCLCWLEQAVVFFGIAE